MSGSRNFLFALAAAILAPFALILLPGNIPPPRGIAVAEAALPAAISTTEATAHIGQTMTVSGIAHVHVARNGSAMFVDLDGVYPDNPFHTVIFRSSMPEVGEVSDLDGKTVDVTGTIEMYRGKPEIVVTSRSQLAAR